MSGEGVAHMEQEPLRSTIDKRVRNRDPGLNQESQELSLCHSYHIEWGGPQCACPVWKLEKSELQRVLLREPDPFSTPISTVGQG